MSRKHRPRPMTVHPGWVTPSIRSGQRLHVSTFVMSTLSSTHTTPSRFGGAIRQIGSMSCPNSPCHAPTPTHTPTTQSYPYALIMAGQLRGKRVLDIPFVLQETCLARCHAVCSPSPSPPLGLVFCCCLGWRRFSIVCLGRFFW
jgi:hypothetical protein